MRNKDIDFSKDIGDEQIERALLVCMFTEPFATNDYKALQGIVAEDDFSNDEFRQVWKIVGKTYEKGKGLSGFNIYTTAKEMGIELNLSRYVARESIFADTESIGALVHYYGQRRRLTESVYKIYLDLIEDADFTNSQALAKLEQTAKEIGATSQSAIDTFKATYEQLLKVTQDRANGLLPQGVPCGFSLIDSKGGLERGELMVVAGRNSNGKTSLALCIALNAAMSGEAVGIFSLEMTNLQLTTRLTSLITGISGESIKRGEMTNEEWTKFVAVDDSAPIYFDRKRSTDGDAVINNIKAMVAQLNVQIVVIDYLQLLRGKERERIQQIGGIAHKLEALSKQLSITIILLSQLRRNQPNDTAPKLEELKESGDIADAADSIYLLYRPERHGKNLKYPDMSKKWSNYPTAGTALLMCVKNRQGAMGGEQLLAFDASTTRFYERDIQPHDYFDLKPSLEDALDL